MARPKGQGNATRERIKAEAMRLFAAKGYAATTTRDIARAVGVKDASLYNHFASKRDLFDAIVESELEHLAATLRENGAMAGPEDSAAPYASADPALARPVVLESFRPFFADERIVGLRRMLETNRYEDARCGELFRSVFIDRPVAIETSIFARLAEAGVFRPCDARFAASEFYGSVFLLLMADVGWEDAARAISDHLEEFMAKHARKESDR